MMRRAAPSATDVIIVRQALTGHDSPKSGNQDRDDFGIERALSARRQCQSSTPTGTTCREESCPYLGFGEYA
jgi:hypothetical protein